MELSRINKKESEAIVFIGHKSLRFTPTRHTGPAGWMER